MAKMTDNQLGYIVDELKLSKKEAGDVLEMDVQKITQLTKAQAHEVIAGTIDRLILAFHPGALIRVDIRVGQYDESEGLPSSFTGNAKMKGYRIQQGEQGLYIHGELFISALNITITRSMSYLKNKATVIMENEQGKNDAQVVLQQYHQLQDWARWLHRNLQRVWTSMLHSSELQPKALKNDRLSPQLKRKLISLILGYLQHHTEHNLEHVDEKIAKEAIREVAGYALFD